MIRNSHCGFVNSKSCQTNLISFFDGVIGPTDAGGGGRAADVICFGFIKASRTVRPDILTRSFGKMDGWKSYGKNTAEQLLFPWEGTSCVFAPPAPGWGLFSVSGWSPEVPVVVLQW